MNSIVLVTNKNLADDSVETMFFRFKNPPFHLFVYSALYPDFAKIT